MCAPSRRSLVELRTHIDIRRGLMEILIMAQIISMSRILATPERSAIVPLTPSTTIFSHPVWESLRSPAVCMPASAMVKPYKRCANRAHYRPVRKVNGPGTVMDKTMRLAPLIVLAGHSPRGGAGANPRRPRPWIRALSRLGDGLAKPAQLR
jgi:hypothetical protein